MAMAAFAATAGGLIRLGISPGLSAGDECGRSREKQLFARSAPRNGLRAAGGDDGERRFRQSPTRSLPWPRPNCLFPRKKSGPRRARRCEFRSRARSRRAQTPRWSAAENRGACRFRRRGLARVCRPTVKAAIVYQDDEVRIAGDDFDARDFSAIGELDGVRFEAGHAHAGGDVDGENAAGVNAVDAANAQAGVGEDFELVAGLGSRAIPPSTRPRNACRCR